MKPREWKIYGVICAEKGSAAWDGAPSHYIPVIEKSAYEELQRKYNAIKTEYDNYINGKPGEWYIVELKNERDELQRRLSVLADTTERQNKLVSEIYGYLGELMSGQVVGTSEVGAGERVKNFAWKIRREIEAHNKNNL